MSKLVKCVDPKNYSLTRNKEYEVDVDPNNRERYLLRNDRNISSRYSTNLFEDVVVEEAVPEPVEVINDTNAILASLNINNASFSYERVQGNRINIPMNIAFNNYESHISCGIRMIGNISGVYRTLTQLLHRDNDLTNEQKNAIANRIYSRMLNNVMEQLNYGAVIASTNTNDPLFEQMNEVMETFNVSTSRVHNPNSGNEIIIYVFNLEREGDGDDDVDIEEDYDE